MQTISVIGAGTMGNGIAHTFAQHGFQVTLIDTDEKVLSGAIDTIRKNLDRQLRKEVINNETYQETLKNITTCTNLQAGVSRANLVVEAATESLAIKLDIFRDIDRLCSPQTILASNTSSISITKIASATQRPDKVIGMHFMNPVPVMKLVEVIRGYSTSEETISTIMNLAGKLGKEPVEAQDYPGFVANRILMPMINEAIYAHYEGVAGIAEIDAVMKLGMAHPMGPLQLADFIGLDVCLAILHILHQGFGNPKYAPCPLLVNMVNAGKLGKKSGQGFYQY